MPDITGYRDLSEQDLQVVNSIKKLELEVGAVWRLVNGLDDSDKRWAAIAKTDLEKAFMCLVRSVTNPQSAFEF